jgi:hypothetical protein
MLRFPSRAPCSARKAIRPKRPNPTNSLSLCANTSLSHLPGAALH